MKAIIIFAFVAFLLHHDASKYATASIINKMEKVIGAGDSIFGGYHRAKAATEAYGKLIRGENDAAKTALKQALTTLLVLDMGSLIPVSTQDIVESFVKNRAFSATKTAIRSYNAQLLSKAQEAARYRNHPQPKTYKRMIALESSLEDMKSQKLSAFTKEIKAIKTTDPQLYKKLGKAKKWLKIGGKVGKALGPLLDVISIGVNVWALTTSEPGSADYTSAAISIAAGVIGVVGFFAALALAAPVIGTVAAITGAILGIVATLIPYFQSSPPRYTVAMALEDKFKDVVTYRTKALEMSQSAVSFLKKTESHDWDYCYVMAQTNIVRWKVTVDGRSHDLVQQTAGSFFDRVLPKELNNVEFGDFNLMFRGANALRNPYTDNKNNAFLHCLPYKGKANVNGVLQYATRDLPDGAHTCKERQSHRGRRNLEKIGFDFVGLKNDRTQEHKKGLIVLCLTNYVNAVSESFRGLDVRTETSRTPVSHRNGDDVVLLDDMRKLRSGKKIKVSTGGGNDVLAVTHFLYPKERKRRYENRGDRTVSLLQADLGSGYDVLSFAGMSHSIGHLGRKIDKRDQSGRIFFNGIFYQVSDGKLGYRYFYRYIRKVVTIRFQFKLVTWPDWTHMKQNIGNVVGVKLFDSSPFDDLINLDLGENYEKDSKNVEDFAVINQRGFNRYTLTISESDNDGYIRKYVILDRSKYKPQVELTLPPGYRNNLVLKNDKILMLYGDDEDGARKQIFIMKMLDLKTTFNLKVNGRNVPLNSLPVSYTDGRLFKVNMNMASTSGTAQNDEVKLVCGAKSDLGNNQDISIDLGEGSKDTVVISTKYFIETCDIGEENNFEDGSENDVDYDVSMRLDATPPNPAIVLKSNNKEKRISLINVERITNDMGSTVVDLTHSGIGNIDLFEKYQQSMQFDSIAVTGITYVFQLKVNLK
ncbi:uncharacterized protein LOC130623764 [Hydractinia symbiolongicarpus]|uniref:uncharacterized protein LOC130623764 n=1 Tax=Hydractinia symbiolongicarpus TaxID=13093 RepID=UPI00254F9AA4|nr:uncharacterized protein LOC130623764 [Hydractinia symbiolongicarpus]